MRTYVYIDGFNLYYGALKGTRFKWLDLLKLSKSLLDPKNNIIKVKYFTAVVSSRPDDLHTRIRQQAYLRALKTIPECEVILGHFLTHNVTMPLSSPPSSGSRMVRVIKTEEKGSDVNLASHLLMDGFKDRYDVAVVISNDSDLLTPIRMAKQEMRKTVGVFTPHQRPSRSLKREASFWKKITTKPLSQSQFPPTLQDHSGMITKPRSW